MSRPLTVLALCEDAGTSATALPARPRDGKVKCGNCGRWIAAEIRDTEYGRNLRFVGEHHRRLAVQDADHAQYLQDAGRSTDPRLSEWVALANRA